MAERADPFAGDFDISGFQPVKPAAKIAPEAVPQGCRRRSIFQPGT